MTPISKAFERLNRPQMRRDMVRDWSGWIIVIALVVCAVIAGVGQ